MNISVALCCLNESENLPIVIQRLNVLDSELGDQLKEVIVVDGGSTDGSLEFLKDISEEWPKLRVLDQRPPPGYGSGYRQSILACSGDVIITCDADLNYDITGCLKMIPLLSSADLIVTNPFMAGGAVHLGLVRTMPTRAVALLYRAALNGKDVKIGVFTPILRVGRVEVFKKALPKANDFGASAEFMMRVFLTANARVCQVPVTVFERGAGRSKLNQWKTVFSHFRLLWRVVTFRLFPREDL